MKRHVIAVAAVVGVLVSACGSDTETATTPPPTGSATSTPWSDDLQAVLDRVHDDVGFPGVIARVVGPDGEWTGYAGQRGENDDAPIESGDHTRVGSITKTMTVTALLQLMEQGKLSLDDPIGRYVPGLPNGDTATLRQLASMTSGIPSYTFDDEFQQKLFADPDMPWTPEQLLDVVRGDAPNFAPGTRFEYSNTNLIALGLVVEQVSGRSLSDYFEEHLFGPLGMDDTVLPTGADLPSPRLQGITEQGQPDGQTADATEWDPSWGWAAGAVTSTIDDLTIWAEALGTGEGILSPETQQMRLDSFQYNVPPATPERAYGLGFGIEDGWVGHTGELPGYNSYIGYLPESGSVMVATVNSDIAAEDGRAPVTVVVEEMKNSLK